MAKTEVKKQELAAAFWDCGLLPWSRSHLSPREKGGILLLGEEEEG